MKKRIIFVIVGIAAVALMALAYLLTTNTSSPAKKTVSAAPAPVQSMPGMDMGQPQAQQAAPPAQPQQQAQGAQQEEEASTVEIPPEKQQLIGVKTVVAEVKSLGKIIRTVGMVTYDERMLATVNTKFEGWIEKLHVDYTGKYVRKGEPLAEI